MFSQPATPLTHGSASPVSANLQADVLSDLSVIESRAIADLDAMRLAAAGQCLGVERRNGETSTNALPPKALEGVRIDEAIIEASRSGNIVQLEPISPMTQRDEPTD